MIDTFRSGVRDLAPVLRPILGADTLAVFQGLADSDPAHFRIPDALWTATVTRAAVAHKMGALHREHLVQALVPLYLGRAASFLLECSERDPRQMEERLEEVCLEFEAQKPKLAEGWTGQK
jgi:hypothetical protein